MIQSHSGRLARASIQVDPGEVEVRLSPKGFWQLRVRAADEQDWRLLCSGAIEDDRSSTTEAGDRAPVRIGALLVEPAGRRVLVGKEEVRLHAREFALLTLLLSEPNRVFTMAEIQTLAFGYPDPLLTTRSVQGHASKLRNKLRRAGADGFVINCHAVGYKLWNGGELASAGNRAA
jgi:DNA-binding response OmpR family regulator